MMIILSCVAVVLLNLRFSSFLFVLLFEFNVCTNFEMKSTIEWAESAGRAIKETGE